MNGFQPCPSCGSKNIKAYAFSICADVTVRCEDCGKTIEFELPWEKNESENSHDSRAYEECLIKWNNRT